MKFSYRWLRELAPGLDKPAVELQRLITMKTAECEGVEAIGEHFASVVAVRIVSVEPLPKGKNKWVAIDAGNGRTANVVCGAPNARPGLLAPWVQPGTQLGSKSIGRASFDGVESEGMLASGAELGINRDTAGLLELPDSFHPGDSLLEADWIIEIDNKSLTHRPDLWGHYGMAREVAAITGAKLLDPVKPSLVPSGPSPVSVEIADYTYCPRFTALVFDNVKVGPSPLWLQARLESLGIHSINNIVDVTNWLAAELPQPAHAYDAAKLSGAKLFTRVAKEGEVFCALNKETYTLTAADLVVADAAGPVGLAGVIGGADSAISETTTRIVFEAANFEPSTVRLSSVRHKIRTDASMRFEKSLDPENPFRAQARAVELLRSVCPGIQVVGGLVDNRGAIPPVKTIDLPMAFLVRKLGKPVTQQETTGILTALGFGIADKGEGLLHVTVPTWRATKDISLKDDLVEEIGRMVGYDSITPTPPLVASTVPPANPLRLYLRKLRAQMTGQGFTEAHNYSFVTEADIKTFQGDPAAHLAVQNPIASELTHMRRSLLPGLLKNVAANARFYPEFRLFEIGSEIHPRGTGQLPNEVTHLAAAFFSAHGHDHDFFELKRVLECAFPGVRLEASKNPPPYAHPVRSAEVLWDEITIGQIFEVHPGLLKTQGVEGRALFFDVDVDAALPIAARRGLKYQPLRKFPTSGFDLSIVTDLQTPVHDLERELTRLGGDDLAFIEFLRQYAGHPLPSGQKSVYYHLKVGAMDRTLNADELTAIRGRIMEGMRQRGYELRGID